MRRLTLKVKSNVKVKINFLRKSIFLWPYLLKLTLRINLRIFIGTLGLAYYTTGVFWFVTFCHLEKKITKNERSFE